MRRTIVRLKRKMTEQQEKFGVQKVSREVTDVWLARNVFEFQIVRIELHGMQRMPTAV
jgi:hypothetical protein